MDRERRHGQLRHRQRALQPPAEVSPSAAVAAALPARKHGAGGLLEERRLAAAGRVRWRTPRRALRAAMSGACGAVRAPLIQPTAAAASRPERTAPSSVAG